MARGMGNRSGSGGKVAASTSNSLPGYVSGSYNYLLKNVKDVAQQDYKKFGKSPLAKEDPMVGQASTMLRNFAGSNWDQGYDDASGIYGGIDARARQLSGFQGQGVNYNAPGAYDPTNFTNQTIGNYNVDANPWNVNAQQINANPWNVNAQQVNANPWDVNAQQVASQQWGADKAQQYMNPYINQVLDVQKNRANLDFRQMQPVRNDAAIQAGAFGGSRHGVVDALAREAHGRNLAEIDAAGMNNAWNQAMGAFAGDRDSALRAMMANQGASLSADQGNQATRLAAAQGNQQAALTGDISNQQTMLNAARYNQEAALRAGQGNQSTMLSAAQGNQNYFLNSGIANQNANLEAQRMAEQSKQYGYTQGMTQADRDLEAQRLSEEYRQSGANISLDALEARNRAAAGIAGITGDRANMNVQMADNLNRYGLQATARDQALRDYQMQQFNEKRDWDKNQLNWMSGILNGVPVNTDTAQSTYVNPYSQILGLGGLGLAAYNAFSGGGNTSGGAAPGTGQWWG